MKRRLLTLPMLVLALSGALYGLTRDRDARRGLTIDSVEPGHDEGPSGPVSSSFTPVLPSNTVSRLPASGDEDVEVPPERSLVRAGKKAAEHVDGLLAVQESWEVVHAGAQAEEEYAELLGALRLSQEDEARLMELLTQQTLAESVSALDVLGTNGLALDHGRLDEIRAQQHAEMEAVDQAIHQVLTGEAYAEYEHFRETRPARREANRIQSQLAERALALDDAQWQAVVEILHKTQAVTAHDAEVEALASLQRVLGSSQGAETGMDRALDETAATYNAILDATLDILDADQYGALQTHYQESLEQQERQASVLAAMAPLFEDLMREVDVQVP